MPQETNHAILSFWQLIEASRGLPTFVCILSIYFFIRVTPRTSNFIQIHLILEDILSLYFLWGRRCSRFSDSQGRNSESPYVGRLAQVEQQVSKPEFNEPGNLQLEKKIHEFCDGLAACPVYSNHLGSQIKPYQSSFAFFSEIRWMPNHFQIIWFTGMKKFHWLRQHAYPAAQAFGTLSLSELKLKSNNLYHVPSKRLWKGSENSEQQKYKINSLGVDWAKPGSFCPQDQESKPGQC